MITDIAGKLGSVPHRIADPEWMAKVIQAVKVGISGLIWKIGLWAPTDRHLDPPDRRPRLGKTNPTPMTSELNRD
jgi:hypothetical protein